MRGEFLNLAGARVYYYAAGTRGAGDPVVLIHGLPTSGHLWSEVVPLLPSGHRILVLDLLGYGRSDPPAGHELSIEAHAGRVLSMLDMLGVARACVVGHDLGGGVAQCLALQQPHRVSYLCLVDTVPLDRPPRRSIRFAGVPAPILRHLPAPLLLAIVRRDLLRGYNDRDRGRRSLDLYLRPFATPAGRDALVQHLRSVDDRRPVDVAQRLRGIDAPTAIVWGARDPFMPAHTGERLRRAIPGSRLFIARGVRHFVPEEAPHVVAEAVRELLAG